MWSKIRRGLMLGLLAGPGIFLAARMAAGMAVPFGAGLPRPERNAGGDAAAVMLISLLLSLLTMFAGFGWLIYRRRCGGSRPEQALMDEVRREAENDRGPPPASPPARAPWEQPTDWWKKRTPRAP